MHKLSLIDDTFLRLESRRQPLHIGMLMLFEPPADAPPDFAARLAARLRQSTATVPPFNQRLERRRGLHYASANCWRWCLACTAVTWTAPTRCGAST